jgi:hypothetical protein
MDMIKNRENPRSAVSQISGVQDRKCNLCGQSFHCVTIFDRYCRICKRESELLRFGDHFPVAEDILDEKWELNDSA